MSRNYDPAENQAIQILRSNQFFCTIADSAMSADSEIVAASIARDISLDSRSPVVDWELAKPIRFASDWQGNNTDPQLTTEVRLLWSPTMLYLKFICRYRDLFVFEDSDPNGRRDHLWDRDVAEAFLQPEPSSERYYKEFEVAPNGMWIDLDISPSGLAYLKSGMCRSVNIDEQRRIWVAELAIPLRSLTTNFDPARPWRANFYRVEGRFEPRTYLAWQSTGTPRPNFHVPEAFGTLRFV
jgi:alpha-galactosidase